MCYAQGNVTIDGAMPATILLLIQICVCLVTVFANLFILIGTVRDKRLKTTTNIAIGSLACVDSFIGMIFIPLIIIMYYSCIHVLYADDGWLKCAIYSFLLVLKMNSDVFVMFLMSIERYLALVHSHQPPCTTNQVVLVLTGVFFCSLVLCVKYVLGYVTGAACTGHNSNLTEITIT